MGVKLRERKNADGSISFRLDIIENGERTVQTLPYKLYKAVTKLDKETNKSKRAEAIKAAADRALALDRDGFITPIKMRKASVTKWMQAYCENYRLKDKRNMQGVTNRFVKFLIEEKKQELTFGNLTEEIVQDFWEYLVSECTGEGDRSYFSRFKKMMKVAYKEGKMNNNVAADVKLKGGGKAKKKDILAISEIQTLFKTKTENEQIKRAFLFSCFTGLRWIDVKQIKWQDIDIANGSMTVAQAKTGISVSIPLNETALSFLGETGLPEKFVFKLPSANGANKTVKAWVKRAGIKKQITWHNARHSFGTNLILTETDVVTTSKLLGHTSLKHTYRYIDTADQLKRKAVNGLKINFSGIQA